MIFCEDCHCDRQIVSTEVILLAHKVNKMSIAETTDNDREERKHLRLRTSVERKGMFQSCDKENQEKNHEQLTDRKPEDEIERDLKEGINELMTNKIPELQMSIFNSLKMSDGNEQRGTYRRRKHKTKVAPTAQNSLALTLLSRENQSLRGQLQQLKQQQAKLRREKAQKKKCYKREYSKLCETSEDLQRQSKERRKEIDDLCSLLNRRKSILLV